MKPFAEPQTPTQGQRQQAQQLADAFRLGQVRVFKREPTTFQAAKEGFNLPTMSIVLQRRLRGLVGDQDEIVIFDPHPENEQRHAPDPSRLREQSGFADPAVLKKPEGGHFTGATGVGHAHIAFDTNTKSNPLPFEKFHPVRPDKVAVRRETLNSFMAERTEKMLEERDPFERVGIATFVQEHPQERDGNTVIGNGEYKNIDIQAAEFPIRAVEAQEPLLGQGKPLHDSGGDLGPGQ